MGRDAADGLVDGREPLPRLGEHRVRRRLQPGGRALKLSAFLLARGSMVVDFDGRIVAQADPGSGSKIVVGPVDVGALRHERSIRKGHRMLDHLRTEAYPVYRKPIFPGRPDR